MLARQSGGEPSVIGMWIAKKIHNYYLPYVQNATITFSRAIDTHVGTDTYDMGSDSAG